MDERFLQPDAVFDGFDLRHGAILRLANGRVSLVADDGVGIVAQPVRGIVSPGLIDLQVNGGGGVLFNATPTPQGIARILAAHRQYGTTGLLPTVITDAPEVMRAAASAVMSAWGMQGLLGIHIEGPHISVAKRGTHAPGFIRPLGPDTIRLAAELRGAGIPVLMTLAPEAASLDGIAELAAMGVVVSIGHSNATAGQVNAALAAGARSFTHLYNAMSPMEGRAPGVVGAALLSSADIGIICDGIHVCDDMVALAIKAGGAGRFHIVSDAMPTVGGPDAFTLYGQTIRVQNGALRNAEGGLAGAHTTMAEGVSRLTGVLGLTMEQALRMAITHPARLIDASPSIEDCGVDALFVWQGTHGPTPLCP